MCTNGLNNFLFLFFLSLPVFDAFICHLQTERAEGFLLFFLLLFTSKTHFQVALKGVIKGLKFGFLKPEDSFDFFFRCVNCKKKTV